MKKLLTVLAASVGIAAFADTTPPLSATSFETYPANVDFSVTRDDDGGEVLSNLRTWAGNADADGDTNVITAYGDAIPPANRPDYYATSNQVNFLKVDSTAGLARFVKKGGVAQGLDSNVYFDMDVQFTVSDSVQGAAEGDKLLVWLYSYEGSNQTNLIITAATVNEATLVPTPVDYVIDATGAFDIQPDTWHRLTVVATSNIISNVAVPFFEVYIDGNNKAVASKKLVTVENETSIVSLGENVSVDQFGSLVQVDTTGDDTTTTTLTSVTFKGTGAVDDLVITTVPPSFIEEPQEDPTFDVGGTGYDTFGAAFNAVAANGTITLLKDYDLTSETSGLGVIINKGVTIALGGKKLSMTDDLSPLMTVSANVTLTGVGTIENGNASGYAVIVSGGTLVIGTASTDDVTITGNVACNTTSSYTVKYFSSAEPALQVTDGLDVLPWKAGTGADAGYYVITGGEAPAPTDKKIDGGAGNEVTVSADTVAAAADKFGITDVSMVSDAQILAYIVGGTTVGTGENEKAVVPTPTISVSGTTVTVVCSGADSDYKVEYYLDYKTDLTAANWTEGTEPVAAGEAHTATLTDTEATAPQKFYRVRAVVSNKLSN